MLTTFVVLFMLSLVALLAIPFVAMAQTPVPDPYGPWGKAWYASGGVAAVLALVIIFLLANA